MLTDAHVNFSHKDLINSVDRLITEGKGEGVSKFLAVNSNLHEFDTDFNLIKNYDCVDLTIGHHPYLCTEVDGDDFTKILNNKISNNREKIKESESFVLTLQKDKITKEGTPRRINVKKILSLDDIINKPYQKVIIELRENYKIEEIKNASGKGKISLGSNSTSAREKRSVAAQAAGQFSSYMSKYSKSKRAREQTVVDTKDQILKNIGKLKTARA